MNRISRVCPKSFPVDKIGRISEYTPHIEHYKPNKKYPNLKTVWYNLFASCPKCNEYKGYKFPDIKPLKPDKEEYNFDYWFEINWTNYKIKPNPLRNEDEQKRAKTTIDWLGLNKGSRPNSRAREAEIFEKSYNPNIEDWSYSFVLERL